ncbi:hypothetical protein BDV93DRAFT_563793 [Ceratobasidium sp. AG-I]|nr:hypothetical protein BDV93DRAFT_563793 [Ceratobasidium sp. AG-I]
MFALKLTLFALFTLQFALALPTALVAREDWKIALGWDGKVTTPVQLDASNASKDAVVKRDINSGVYFCTEDNFRQPCVYVSGFRSGQCVTIGNGFNDKISSFGPDPGMSCTIFADENCSGRSAGGITQPGFNSLADVGMNDAMSTFVCFG